ncbi:hypothetical protein FUAX_06280 [Fulvitalea axinellae]|uniref:Hydrazine synthase alpha subunit middle domain-containing protein n=1 Tax=Fulvitalea axinellae TaxID=1182444 RepID=A0AAU9C7X9_9BACT|nr:hypothetical protein FUAX_06280 [Fulvitalea axinellae]
MLFSLFIKKLTDSISALTALVTFLCISGMAYGQYSPPKATPRYFDRKGYVQIDVNGKRLDINDEGLYKYEKPIGKGDNIRITGSPYLRLRLTAESPASIIYVPGKDFLYTSEHEFFPPSTNGKYTLECRVPELKELRAYRNLALNPYDWQKGEPKFYPHVSSNSECRGENRYRARNAVNGLTHNLKHGQWKYRSWGPEKVENPEWAIDFGRAVEVDKLAVYIRADFPHDSYWRSATIEFSDGSKEKIKLKKTEKKQVFKFKKRRITGLKIKDLKQPKPLQWCALTEVEVWGKDVLPVNTDLSWAEAMNKTEWSQDVCQDSLWLSLALDKAYPIRTDWLMQDLDMALPKVFRNPESVWPKLLDKVCAQIKDRNKAKSILAKKGTASLPALYEEACQVRRKEFLAILENKWDRVIFMKRKPIMMSFFAYTEAVSDARHELNFYPDSELCELTIENGEISVNTILKDKKGVFRDPDISFDGTSLLYSHKKGLYDDDYHLYEMDLATKEVKQLTFGERLADFEGQYLPTGDIIFNSTRVEHTVDCWQTEVSNLHLMKRDGKYIRRIGFDQVQTPYPTLMENGKIVYTRWDYNDRGQIYPQPLFQMNMDGTGQTEYYGNNSWYPTTLVHARNIPGTNKVMATVTGHHTQQRGQLAIIDPAQGRQENQGVTLLAPVRKPEAVKVDVLGQKGPQFQYPFPLSEEHFLVTYEPFATNDRNKYYTPYGLYFMDKDGRRELLATDPMLDCKQAMPVRKRGTVHMRESTVDYRKKTGTYFVYDVYHGEASKGIERGSIKKIRIVEIEYQTAPIGFNRSYNHEGGAGQGARVSTPISVGDGAWDVKRIIGEVPVEADGSAMFEVPARTPVYFQLIDANGHVAQTMRTWSTLQPGEVFACVGCHENKNETPIVGNKALAMKKGVRKPKPFHGITEGFSFRKHVQPILDAKCISCHDDRTIKRLDGGKASVADLTPTKAGFEAKSKRKKRAFSLLDHPVMEETSGRAWNDAYLNLLKAFRDKRGPLRGSFKDSVVNWPGSQSMPTILPPYFRGSATSELTKMLDERHGGVKLSRKEKEIIACWIDLYVPYGGDYEEGNIWNESQRKRYDYYQQKRDKREKEELESIRQYIKDLSMNQ